MDMLWYALICHGTERRNTMNRKNPRSRLATMGRMMIALSVLGAVLAVVLRVWVSPSQRDMETGLFASNTPVMILMLLVLGGLAAIVFVSRGGVRQEIKGKPALVLAVTLLAVGAAMVFTGGADLIDLFRSLKSVVPVDGSRLATMLQWGQQIFCLLGGAALVRLGLVLASEGATRRGIAQWSMLAPVLWVWLILANYEMSYASMVRFSDGFFTLMTYILEMLFLLYFARYVAGVGKVGSSTLLLFSCGAALFAISTPMVQLLMYLLRDSEEYAAAGSTGVLDMAIGLLALVVSITLWRSLSAHVEEVPEEADSTEEEEQVEWPSEGASDVELIEVVEDPTEEEQAEFSALIDSSADLIEDSEEDSQ